MHSERHMFPGGNTSRGFYSYYNYILPQSMAEHIYVLKGGPGVGKSTFMKKVAQKFAQQDLDIELMHCSSDPNSLDGIVIPQKKIAIIDGTSPHVVDPRNPGATDEIINLGEFWNLEGIKKNKYLIMSDNAEVGRLFTRAYRYLAAATYIYLNNEEIYAMASDKAQINKFSDEIISDLFIEDEISNAEGKQRHLFASAITPDGLKNHLSSILNTTKKIVLKGSPGTGTEKILAKVLDAACARGYDTECFYCAFFPEKLEHIVIPEKDISITTSNKYHTVPVEDYGCYNLDHTLNNNIIKTNEDFLQYNQLEFEGLLNRAVFTISKAKELHDHMEQYYIPHMDFDAVDRRMDEIIDRILK